MNTSLKTHIEALGDSLKQTKTVDVKTRESLAVLQRDIEEFLHAHGDSSLTERLEELAVRFENDHPTVGTALRQAIDALSKAGM